MRWLLALFFVLNTSLLLAQQVHIGLLRHFSIKSVAFFSDEHYFVVIDDKIIDTLNKGEQLKLVAANAAINVFKNQILLGAFSKLSLLSSSPNSVLEVDVLSPSLTIRKYRDDFSVFSKNNKLTLVNDVSLRHYLAGVVESEGGGNNPMEYYKVQAIISRTYAMKNEKRHDDDGFQLCDGVHCQAYKSMMRFTSEIQTAVDETKGMVLTDSSGKLIDAFFHANCGGQTSLSEYVWNHPLSYIHTFIDTFCIHTSQATWVKKIPKSKWKNYLIKEFAYPIDDSIYGGSAIYNFKQEKRMPFYKNPVLGIPLRDLRRKFRLKSTFFSCRLEGEYVVLNGRGYGHGIGLCQEGAMSMARYGYTYKQILQFYFSDIQLILMKNLHYFKQEVKSPFDF